jgi:hypothetical protein
MEGGDMIKPSRDITKEMEGWHRKDYPHSPVDATRYSEEHYVNGYPDFSRFDDTIEDEEGDTDRDRAMLCYYDLLDQRQD